MSRLILGDWLKATIVVNEVVRRLRRSGNSVLADTNQGLHIVTSAQDSRGPNVLANELIGTELMKALALPHAAWGIATASRSALSTMSSHLSPFHRYGDDDLFFASKFPTPPHGGMVYCFMPGSYVPRIRNRSDFVGVLVFDLWAASTTLRQTFYLPNAPSKTFSGIFTNNGGLFGGPAWDFRASIGASRCSDRRLYERLVEPALVDSWVRRVENVVPVLLPWIVRQVPQAWYAGDISELCDTLLGRLSSLRERVYEELIC